MKKVFENSDENVLKKEFRELLACQASSTRFFRRLVDAEHLAQTGLLGQVFCQTQYASIRVVLAGIAHVVQQSYNFV